MFKVFYLHYSKNKDRKAYLKRFVEKELPGQLISEFDREDINPNDHYKFNRADNYMAICSFANVLADNLSLLKTGKSDGTINISALSAYQMLSLTPGEISLSNLSLNLKHQMAWERLASSNSEWGVILEDDVIFHASSVRQIISLVEQLCNDIDFVDIGGGCGLKPRGARFLESSLKDIYIDRFASTRTTCAYIINRRLAKSLIKANLPILFPIDFQLNYCFSLLNPTVCWSDPELVIHGSEHGYYLSSNKE